MVVQAERLKVPLTAVSSIIDKAFALYDPELGFLRASGESGVFARPFGRDTMISERHKLKAYELNPDICMDQTFPAVAYILLHIPEKDIPKAGIYRGEAPHEMGRREQGYPENFGYIDETGFGICCDSADATDLTMLTVFELEEKFTGKLQKAVNRLAEKLKKPSHDVNYYVQMMTEWAVKNTMEYQGSAYIGAEYNPERDTKSHKGLNVQFWRDSEYSVTKEDGTPLIHPVYPAEEQTLRWSALKKAGARLANVNPGLAYKALLAAELTKQQFNKRFIYEYEDRYGNFGVDNGLYIASAVDGQGYKSKDVSCDEITLLSHVFQGEYFIDDPKLQRNVTLRSYRRLFTELGGFRTVDRRNHPENIYHGPDSIWPHRQADIVYAVESEAQRVKDENPFQFAEYRQMAINIAMAGLRPIFNYKNPMELVLLRDGGYDIFRAWNKLLKLWQESARVQAFSAFAALYLMEYLKTHQVEEIELFHPQAASYLS